MPKVALALGFIWFFVLFVARSWIQWRQTGSTGIKGFHGRIGSLPWIAGTSTSLGLVLAPLAPIATLLDWPGGVLWFENEAVHGAGAMLAGIGILGALGAQLSMGDSWRIGVDESERTRLVTDGLFELVRNPIFSFISVSGLGFWLVVPNAVVVASMVCVAFGIEAQVRAVEEPYLMKTHGAEYARYAARVGRFIPGLGRSTAPLPPDGRPGLERG